MIEAYPIIIVEFETVTDQASNPQTEERFTTTLDFNLIDSVIEDDIKYLTYYNDQATINIEIEQDYITRSELTVNWRSKNLNWETIAIESHVFLNNEQYANLTGVEA